MTLTLFNKLYKNYKMTFNLETRLKNANKTYDDLEQIANNQNKWF